VTKLSFQKTAKLSQWWKPKATNLLTVLYTVMLITSLQADKALILFLPSLITILGIGSFGHLVNDWNDIESDLEVGKPNRLANMSLFQRWGLLLISILFALAPWLVLPYDQYSIGLLIMEFSLLILYAVRPVRLKEKILWSILVDSAYAYAVPAVLAAHTFFLASKGENELLLLGFLFVWQLALGQRHFLNHLALDRPNDIRVNTRTLATVKGNRFIHRLVSRAILPIEILGFIGFMIIVARMNLIFAIACFTLWFILNSFHFILALGRDYSFVSYRFSKMTVDSFYQNYLPYLPLLFLLLTHWLYAVLVVAHSLLFIRFKGRLFFQGMLIPRNVLTRYVFYYPMVILLSPLYLLSKINQEHQSDESGFSEDSTASSSVPTSQLINDHKSLTNIAVVNISRSKYTETFIWKMIPKLPFNIFYLYGNELPLYDHDQRHFLSNWTFLQKWAEFIEALFRMEDQYFLKRSVTSYLYAKKVRLVLAQFGPVGVQLLPITRDLGIPLVVNFHGYDVFHQQTLNQFEHSYQDLFEGAYKIIAVSELMKNRLMNLGAPREKLVHLPAYVDLDLFSYCDHSNRPPRFLAVGRFTETKSPHLTLLAFKEVVHQVPDATLTFIGKGGGGELYEACVILCKALGISDHVEFLGIKSPEVVAEAMKNARVFVQQSLTTPENRDMEGKPVAIMEAMACGLPVVSTKHSAIPELIEHAVSGVLVEEYDIREMAHWMIKLANDHQLVKKIGINASQRIHNDPLIKNHLQYLSEIIRDAL